jgi:hypothetical protein
VTIEARTKLVLDGIHLEPDVDCRSLVPTNEAPVLHVREEAEVHLLRVTADAAVLRLQVTGNGLLVAVRSNLARCQMDLSGKAHVALVDGSIADVSARHTSFVAMSGCAILNRSVHRAPMVAGNGASIFAHACTVMLEGARTLVRVTDFASVGVSGTRCVGELGTCTLENAGTLLWLSGGETPLVAAWSPYVRLLLPHMPTRPMGAVLSVLADIRSRTREYLSYR